MSWPGYFFYGGTEIINTSRTEAYARHHNVGWFKPIYNESDLAWLIGDPEYTTPLQDDAPWTDTDNLNSYDFYGVYPLEITGIEDSTVTAEVTESVVDGGYIGRVRRSTRSMVFSAALVGASECAVEYGLRWLRTVLNGQPCFSKTYGVCGGADLCYLACPPVVGEPKITYSAGPLAVDAMNQASNPSAEVSGADGWTSADAVKYTLSAGTADVISGTKSVRSVRIGPEVIDGTNLLKDPSAENPTLVDWNLSSATKAQTSQAWSGKTGSSSLAFTANQPMLIANGTFETDLTGWSATTWVRTNLTSNPNFESSSSGWSSNNAGVYPVSLDTVSPVNGLVSLMSTRNNTVTNSVAGSIYGGGPATGQQVPIQANTTYTMAMTVKSDQTNRRSRVGVIWYDSSKVQIGATTYGSYVNLTQNQPGRPIFTGTSPAGAAYLYMLCDVAAITGNAIDTERAWYDNITIEQGTTDGSYFDGSVRVNQASNPGYELNANSFFSLSSSTYVGSADTTAPISGSKSFMTTRSTSAPTNTISQIAATADSVRLPVTPGTPVTAGMNVKTNQSGVLISTRWYWYDAGLTLTAGTRTTRVASTVANQVYRVSETGYPPVGTVSAYFVVDVFMASGLIVGGELVWADDLTIETGVTSGTQQLTDQGILVTAPLPSRSNMAINSTLESNVLTGWGSNDTNSYVLSLDSTAPISGTRSALSTRTGTLSDTVASIFSSGQIPAGRLSIIPGQAYTVGVTIKDDQSSRQARAYFVWYDAAGAQVSSSSDNIWTPLVNGQATRVAHTATAPAGAASLYAIVRVNTLSVAVNAVAGERTWFDNLTIEAGATDGSWFDLPILGDHPGVTLAWTGTVNASTSTRTATAVLTRDTTRFRSGVASLRANLSPATTQLLTFAGAQLTGLTVGRNYTLEAWFYIPNASIAQCQPLIRVTGLASSAAVTVADQWVKTSVTFAATSANHPWYIYNTKTSTLDTSFYVDDVRAWDASTQPYLYALGTGASSRVPCVENDLVYARFTVGATTVPVRVKVGIAFYNSGGTQLGNFSQTNYVPIAAGAAATIDFTSLAAPATTAGALALIYLAGDVVTGPDPGTTMLVDGAIVQVNKAITGYFDGSTSATSQYTYRWTGTPNASPSQRVLTTVADPVASSVILTASSTVPYVCEPGEPITVAFDVKVERPSRSITGHIDWFGGGSTSPVTIPAGAPGTVVRLVLTGTPPAGCQAFTPVVDVSSTAGNDVRLNEQVWFDNLYVGDDPAGVYFDGNTPASGEVSYAWTGTPDASTSVRFVKTYVADPLPTAEDCYNDIGRSLHEVTTTVGPNVTKKMSMNDGGEVWTVTWTMVAANPAEFGVERPLVVGFLDPDVDIPYYGGVIPPGGDFDEAGIVQSDPSCPVVDFRPVFDPTCTLLTPPPPVPDVVPKCFSFPVNYRRYSFNIPREQVPVWSEVVPVVSLTTKEVEARSVRLRFYADMFATGNPSSDPCNFCGDVVFSYIPPSSTLVLDGADRQVYIDSPGLGRRRADALVSDSTGNPFEWPNFSCGFGYVVTVDMPQQQQSPPVIDLSLVPRTL